MNSTRIVIDADTPARRFQLGDLWHNRELLFFLVWRELTVRFKQTALGIGWVILQPIVTALIFSVVFGLFLRAPSYDVPFIVFFLCGFVPWRLLSDGVTRASASVVSNAHLIDKVYFPRIVLPAVGILTPVVDYLVANLVVIGTILLFGINPITPRLLAIPVLILMILLIASALSLWFAAMNVKYRDVGQFLPFILQIGFYASPIIYPVQVVQQELPGWLFTVYQFNPMVSIIEGFRWALVDTPAPDWTFLAASMTGVMVLLVGGMMYFSASEQSFGDVI